VGKAPPEYALPVLCSHMGASLACFVNVGRSQQGMRQVNIETHGSRPVRRTVERGHADWTCSVCSYHNQNNPGDTCLMCEQGRS
jgi:hypothetical protein